MNDDVNPPQAVTAAPPSPPPPPPAPAPVRAPGRGSAVVIGVLALLAVGGIALGWTTKQELQSLEQELVRRQQDSQTKAAEAQLAARAAQDEAREAGAKAALLEARVAENTLQRTQLEELMQSLSRSRDENLVADLDAAVRVALQQTAITGSAEPLVSALQQADERLARANQPRLARVRAAVVRDLDRVKSAGVADLSTLAIRLDELVRRVDELPLAAAPEPMRRPARPAPKPAAATATAPEGDWRQQWREGWNDFTEAVWTEVRALVRVSRIDHPEAALVAPEQAFFLRENVKLRLLNARLAILSRQFETAQADLRDVQSALDRYFDRESKRVQAATDLLRQVAQQARLVSVPRPDETLAALAAVSAGK